MNDPRRKARAYFEDGCLCIINKEMDKFLVMTPQPIMRTIALAAEITNI